MAERHSFAVGVSVKAAPAPFERTKVVSLAPRYVIVNAMDRAVEVQQAGLGSDVEPLKVCSGAQAAFHWPQAGTPGWFGAPAAAGSKNRRLVLRFCGDGDNDGDGGRGRAGEKDETGWNWSGEILPEGGVFGGGAVGRGVTTLRLRNGVTREVAFVRVGTSVKGSSVRLVLRNELPSFAPYRIDNFSLETLTLRQVGGKVVETLLPNQTCVYSWDEPLGERSLIVERLLIEGYLAAAAAAAAAAAGSGAGAGGGGGRGVAAAPRAFVGIYGLDLMRPSTSVGNLKIEMTAEGATRVLRFTDTRSALSLNAAGRRGGRARSVLNSISDAFPRARPGKVVGSSRADPATAASASGGNGGGVVSLEAGVRLAGIGVSVIDTCPRELLYLTVGDIALEYLREGQGDRVRANIGKLQIDNQLVVTPYPALLYPIVEALPPRHAAVRRHPAAAVAEAAAAGDGAVPFASLFDIGAIGSPDFGGRGREEGGGVQDSGQGASCFEAILHRDLGYTWVNFFRLASVRLAPLDVNVDVALVAALVEAATRIAELVVEVEPPSSNSGRGAAGVSIPQGGGVAYPVEGVAEAEASSGGLLDKLYFSELAISPIRVQVSLTSRRSDGVLEHLLPPPDSGGEDGGSGGGGGGAAIAFAVLRAMGTTMSEIENASLRLKPLVLSHAFTSPDELVQMLVAHYRGQAMRQVFAVLGSSKVLGSPLGILNNMRAGVKDFFYEPIVGLSLSRSPIGFAAGVFKGTSSLVRRILYSVTDTTDRIVSSVSSGILASGAVDVSVRGGTGVVRPFGALDGMMLGVAGAVREPLMGLNLGGFSGMATGLFTGWVGLVLRPTYGALMSTSQLCQIVSWQLDPRLDSEQKLRMLRTRPPRFFRSREQILSVYSREENVGEELLSRVHMGRYRSDGYVWHATLEEGMIVLVTGRRVFMLHGGGVDSASSAASKQHIYGVVEWEVDFALVVWLEIDADLGAGMSSASPAHSSGESQEVSLSMYHFPDLCAEVGAGDGRGDGGNGSAGGRQGGADAAALRLVRRVMVCADLAQAQQTRRVLSRQMSALQQESWTRAAAPDHDAAGASQPQGPTRSLPLDQRGDAGAGGDSGEDAEVAETNPDGGLTLAV